MTVGAEIALVLMRAQQGSRIASSRSQDAKSVRFGCGSDAASDCPCIDAAAESLLQGPKTPKVFVVASHSFLRW